MKTVKPSNRLNRDRLNIIRKGYISKRDLQTFIPCGYNKANKLYEHLEKTVLMDGKTVGMFGLDPKRVLDYLNMTEAQIRKYAMEETEAEKDTQV